MNPTNLELVGTILFAVAVFHTFMVSKIQHLAHKYPEGSMMENLLHFLGEVEAVFGMWAAVFIGYYAFSEGLVVYNEDHSSVIGGALKYLEQDLNFTEPAFVFVIMCMAGTRPVIVFAEKIILAVSKLVPLPGKMAFFVTTLIVGPILGSFITEPAAMTVTALILLDYFFCEDLSPKFRYATLGLLFVNVSIGGTLSHFAAPPVLMVATKWKWDFMFMLTHFGYKAVISIVLGTLVIAFMFKKELTGKLEIKAKHEAWMQPTWWMTLSHLVFMALVVYTAHHMVFFLGLFLFFLGFANVTKEYQDKIKLKESLLVGFFLGGLVVLGKQQGWWLQPLIGGLNDAVLFVGSTGLTAITDNAALTYLGTLVELTDSAKYSLVAGAVAGGGLTVIANAPNPAGFGILKASFGEDGISPIGLLLGALFPTVLAMIFFWILPSL